MGPTAKLAPSFHGEASLLSHCVTPANRSRYVEQLDQMFRQRHALFVEKKGWRELRREDGRDIDAYDGDETVYILVMGDAGEVFASARLNPTWARHQLEEGSEFRAKYTQHRVPCGPKAWECSRLIGGDGRLGRDHITESFGRLMVAVGEFCRRRSVSEIISILETAAVTQFQTQGYRCEPLGLPVRFDTDRGPSDAIATIIRPRAAGAARESSAAAWVGPAMFEAASARHESENEQPGFALLESAAELTSEEGQRRALAAVHALIEWEMASRVGEVRRRAAN